MMRNPYFTARRRAAILKGLRDGLLYKEIAKRINLSTSTVKWYMSAWFREERLYGHGSCRNLLLRKARR